MNIYISCSSLITHQNRIICCTHISRPKTWLSLSKILLPWQHCRFQALFQNFKECSVITCFHKIFKKLYHLLVLDMNAKGKSTHNVNFCLRQKNNWSTIVLNKRGLGPTYFCLGNGFLYMINFVHTALYVFKVSFDSDKQGVS